MGSRCCGKLAPCGQAPQLWTCSVKALEHDWQVDGSLVGEGAGGGRGGRGAAEGRSGEVEREAGRGTGGRNTCGACVVACASEARTWPPSADPWAFCSGLPVGVTEGVTLAWKYGHVRASAAAAVIRCGADECGGRQQPTFRGADLARSFIGTHASAPAPRALRRVRAHRGHGSRLPVQVQAKCSHQPGQQRHGPGIATGSGVEWRGVHAPLGSRSGADRTMPSSQSAVHERSEGDQ